MSRRRSIAVVVLTVAVISGGVAATLGTTADAEREPVAANLAQQVTDQSALAVQNETANASVTFENQSSNGTTVTIAQATLEDGGFVVVHDRELLNGSVLDSVLGSSAYLEPGTHENVTVTFEEPIEEDQLLLAIAYQDTNGNETFDFVSSLGEDDGAYVVDEQVVIDDAEVTVEEAAETTQAETTGAAETTTEGVETTEAETTESVETTTAVETTVEEPVETTTEAVETTTEAVETTTEEAETTTTEEAETTTTEIPETTTTAAEPALRVANVVSPERVDIGGGSLAVNAQIENPSDEELTETVQLRVNGTVVQERNVTVSAGETVEVQFEVPTSELELGVNYVGVLTRDFGDVRSITGTEITNETTTDEMGTTTEMETTTA